jgi:hypothetical protein
MMAGVNAERVSARIEGDFVVFLIGMRINRIWMPGKWVPTARAMGAMLKELYAAGPETGFLGHQPLGTFNMAQYWRSFEHLEAYARSKDRQHWPAWVEFNRRMKSSRGDVGIWHETYLVPAGQYEAIYSGMPDYGLARAAGRIAVTEANDAARQRIATGHVSGK